MPPAAPAMEMRPTQHRVEPRPGVIGLLGGRFEVHDRTADGLRDSCAGVIRAEQSTPITASPLYFLGWAVSEVTSTQRSGNLPAHRAT